MGQMVSAESSIKPNKKVGITFDPLYGFPEGRKERVMQVSEDEMRASHVPKDFRDYCAHLLIENYKCRSDVWPLVYKCHHQKHEHSRCQHEDYVIRMKEYERERRLLMRQKRKEARNE